MDIEEMERRIALGERAFADALMDDIYSDPSLFVGPPRPMMTWQDYANDPRYYLDTGFPHCWMPRMGYEDDIEKNPYKYYRGEK